MKTECIYCEGTGEIMDITMDGYLIQLDCKACDGTGKLDERVVDVIRYWVDRARCACERLLGIEHEAPW